MLISYFSIFIDKFSLCIFDQTVANIGPAMLCHTAANTLGSAAAGPKCKILSSYITYRF